MNNLSLKYKGAIILAIIGIASFVFVLSAIVYTFSLGMSGGPTPSVPPIIYIWVFFILIISFIFFIIVPLLFLKEIKSNEFLQHQINTWIIHHNIE